MTTTADGNNDTDRLVPFLSTTELARDVLPSLQTDGYYIIRSVLAPDECASAVDKIWDFVEDTSGGVVSRSDPASWYPQPKDDDDDDDDEQEMDDPFPHTGYKSFSDMFQTNGAGWVHGTLREILAERVFEPLYGTRELHCSKEGFTFHRPTTTISQNNNHNGSTTTTTTNEEEEEKVPSFWLQRLWEQNQNRRVCGKVQTLSMGEHYDQLAETRGLWTIQSLVALEDQHEGVDGCFQCWPGSHGSNHAELTANKYRGRFVWFPLTDEELVFLRDVQGLTPRRIYLGKGDVLLWRSDLAHTPLPPQKPTPRFRTVVYTSMQPASLTPHDHDDDDDAGTTTPKRKMTAYKQRRTGDHRPDQESWHSSSYNNHKGIRRRHRCHYRLSPPLVTRRQAELYGLLSYPTHTQEDMERAMIRGVRFVEEENDDMPASPLRQQPQRCDAFLETTKSGELLGQDKYLGGVPSPCGKYVYGVPGSARRVLRIDVATNEADMIGPSFPGKFKWLRGVEIPASVMGADAYPQGCCIALPSNADCVLKINPTTNQVTTFGHDVLRTTSNGGWGYHGGQLANGMIYAIPANAPYVLKVCPRTERVWTIGPDFGDGHQKWFGGILGVDGCVYGIPHNATSVLKINPHHKDECTTLPLDDNNNSNNGFGRWKWHGGVAAGDKIYGFPNNADEVLVVHVPDQRVYTVGDASILQSGRHRIPQDGRYKYLGGASTLDGSMVYLFPCDAERVLKIHTETDRLELIGPPLLEGENKFQNGFVARDGCLYGIPQRALGILRIDPTTDHVDIMPCQDNMAQTKDKFEGGVVGGDGCIYCMPLRAKACVKIVPARTIRSDK